MVTGLCSEVVLLGGLRVLRAFAAKTHQDRIYPHPLADRDSDHGFRPWFELLSEVFPLKTKIRPVWVGADAVSKVT